MDENANSEQLAFEDISSSSLPKSKASLKAVNQAYGNGIFKHLDKIIKTLAFLLSVLVLLVSAAAAFILFKIDKLFLVVSVAVMLVGILLSALTLFIIYAIGHVISQNNEILKRL